MLNSNNKDYNEKYNYNLNIENNLKIFKKKSKNIDKFLLNDKKIPKNKSLLKHKKQEIYKIDIISEKVDNIINKSNSKIIKKRNEIILNKDEDLQDMDYDEAIIYDKRYYLRMYWPFLLESQIIL